MGSGQLFGSVFFVLLFAAALSSCIGCGEAVTFWMRETFRIPREPAIALVCVSAWIIGIVMILSLGAWSGFHPLDFIPALHGMSLYDATDFLAANILLLAGALLTAVFFGWIVPDRVRLASINLGSRPVYYLWLVLLRFVIPPVLVIVLVRGLTA
jgi:NSS family neurotransmitter:Na+ symporter